MSALSRQYVRVGELNVDAGLHQLIAKEAIVGTGLEPDAFWQSLAQIVTDLGPKNRQLLTTRDKLQAQIDEWHKADGALDRSAAENIEFLRKIGYLAASGPAFEVAVENVDPEIADINAPQLVVPVDNARYALNAANARWGSLYDALYVSGIAEPDGSGPPAVFEKQRAARVMAWARDFLDRVIPLQRASHHDAADYAISSGSPEASHVEVRLKDDSRTRLAAPQQFSGFAGSRSAPAEILFSHNKLSLRLQFDRTSSIGKTDAAGLADIALEAAVTTIQDFEDAIAAVDAHDKANAYRNWLNLMKGTLTADLEQDGKTVTRSLHRDLEFTGPDGAPLQVPARSCMLARHVGLHMYTDAVTTAAGAPIPEGFLDAMVISLGAIHNLSGQGSAAYANSRCGSVYAVKPKLHGPDEVAATVELFSRVEDALGLARNTLKIGIMDEERRTTVNLRECIRAARSRVIFINTGFLDRTGDEIHTVMHLGAVITKDAMKNARWLQAYEKWNVDAGLQTGVHTVGQIGKGMWTMPDRMQAMYSAKSEHLKAGANTAWVPSPTVAVLHALHYHENDADAIQQSLAGNSHASLEDILTPPILREPLSHEQIARELESAAQSILGYVVRWVEAGIGCSKIPDINDISLMEDRATLRISSQLIANWLHHGLTARDEVLAIFKRMAATVDRQNETMQDYHPMAADFEASIGFQAALDLVFQGAASPNGYTESILHQRRREAKTRGV